MSSKKDNLKKQFKQNKINRVESKNKKYNKTTSKSDQNYINGNYKKSISQKVYGVKKSLANGEKVNGYGDDYIDTKGMKRSRYVKKQNGENPYEAKYAYQPGKPKYVEGGTRKDGSTYDGFYSNKRLLKDYEKESYKNTGTLNHKDYMPKKSYKVFDSANEDAKTFKEHLNTFSWDGLKTAKENQRTGKHLSNAFEYIKGGAKDILLDPVVDAIKGADYLGSTTVAGVAGLAEDSGNIFKAIADPNRDLKYYTKGKSYTKENLKSNFNNLNKTGSGQSMSKYLQDARKRGYEENYNLLKEQGRHKEAEEYKKNYESETPTATKALNVTGFIGDLLAPSTLENMAVGVGKGLVKNTAKSFKDMVKGTADISTAILPEETAKLMSKAKKYTGKGSGASDDVFYAGKKNATVIDNKLDNQYSKAMDRAKDTIKQSLKTPNLSKFVDELDNAKPYSGKQINIDGRTLNKKYTQTKDGYIPNKISDEVDELVDNKLRGQYSMFGKDGSMNAYINNIKNPYARYENVLKKFDGDIDGLAEKLDSMKPENADLMYDYIQKYKPNLYKELTKGSDEINNLMLKNDKYNLGNISDELSSVEKIKELNENYNKLNERRFLESINGSQDKISARLKVGKGKEVFSDVVGKYLFGQLPNKSVDELELVSGKFSSMIKMLDKPNTSPVVAKELNNFLFGGKNVIRNNMYPGSLKQILEYFNEIVDYQKAVQNGEDFINFKNPKLPSEFKIFDEFGNPALNKKLDLSSLYAPSATDSMFDIKREDLGKMFGVKNKGKEIDDPISEYIARKQKGEVLNEEEFRHFKALESKQDAWKKVYEDIKDLNPKEYEEYARKHFNKNTGYHDMLDELAEKQSKIDATKGKENILLESKRNQELGSDPSKTASPRSQNLLHDGNVDEWDQVLQKHTEGNIKNIPFKDYKIKYSKDLGLNYINIKYPIQISKSKQTLKGVRNYKPVDNAISNLEKLMNKEVSLSIKGKSNTREYEAIRTLVKENVQMLNKLGVSNDVYFNHIKDLKMKLLQDGQISKNLNGTSVKSGKVKNTAKNINPLEMAHIKINGKGVDNIDELTPDQLQWKYLLTEGAKTIDELFDVVPGTIPQRGDNIASEIGSNLRPKNTPLNEILSKNDKVDEVDGFEKFNEDLNIEDSKNILEQIKNKSDKPKERATIDPRTEERLKYYENKLNLPTPKTLDELDFNVPGVDEDGVITNLDELYNRSNNKNVPNVTNNSEKLPYEKDYIFDKYKRWLNSYKKGLTVYNPGWHVQNYFQNKGQNYLALGVDAFKPQTGAKNILKYINGEDYVNKRIKSGKDTLYSIISNKDKSYSVEELGKLAQDFNVVDGLGEDVKNARGIFTGLENYIDNTPLMKLLDKNEQTARLHHFVKQIEKGMTPEEAAKSVNKYLFDYGKKNNFDKVVGDFIDPFWTFHKNNARLLYTSGIEHGDKIAKINRATNGLEEGIPQEQLQNEESKYGKIQLPYSTHKDDVNNDDYNFLYNQGIMPDFEGAFPLSQDSLENKLSPILRLAMQQSRGEGNFGNKIVEGDEAGWNEITKKDRFEEVLNELNPFMPNLVKTINSHKERQQKADDNKQSQATTDRQIFFDWLNYITGSKGNWYRNLDM